MRSEETKTERSKSAQSGSDGAPVQRLPRRGNQSTKQMHERLLRALSDRRIKRAFS